MTTMSALDGSRLVDVARFLHRARIHEWRQGLYEELESRVKFEDDGFVYEGKHFFYDSMTFGQRTVHIKGNGPVWVMNYLGRMCKQSDRLCVSFADVTAFLRNIFGRTPTEENPFMGPKYNCNDERHFSDRILLYYERDISGDIKKFSGADKVRARYSHGEGNAIIFTAYDVFVQHAAGGILLPVTADAKSGTSHQ